MLSWSGLSQPSLRAQAGLNMRQLLGFFCQSSQVESLDFTFVSITEIEWVSSDSRFFSSAMLTINNIQNFFTFRMLDAG